MGIKDKDKINLLDGEEGVAVPGGTPVAGAGKQVTVGESVTESPLTTPAVTETAASGTTIAAAPQIEYLAQSTTPKQSFEEWMSAGGYDPDKEYADAKNNLEYEYMKANSKYGENAERLAQMGLSSSGVSDVFQLGAFNSYLQSENDLAARRIEQMREYRNQYSQYEQGWQSGYDTDVATAHNLGLQYYDGTNGEYVSQILKNQGFSQDVINKTLTTLGTYDVNALPTIKQRIADEQAKTEAFNNAVAEGYAKVLESGMYNGSNASELKQRLENLGYSAEEAAAIVERLTGDEALGKNIQNDTVNAYYEQYKGEYTPETEARIRAELAGTPGEAVADALIEKLKANYNATPEEQRPGYVDMNQVHAVAEQALIDSDGALHDYNGSAEQKRLIKLALDAQGLGKYYDEIIGDYDDKLTAGFGVDKNGNYSGDITQASLEKIFNAYKNTGAASGAKDREKYRNEATAAIKMALNDETTLANAYNLVGIDRTTWSGMSDWERLNSVMNAAGDYSKQGFLDKSFFNELAADMIESNFKAIDISNKSIDNLVNSWISAGYINSADDIGLEKVKEKLREKMVEEASEVFGLSKNASETGTAKVDTEGERGTLTVTLNGNTKDLPGEAVRDESVIGLVKRQAKGDGKVKFAYLTGENNEGLYAIDTETGVVLKVDKDDVALISMGKEPYMPAKGYYGK